MENTNEGLCWHVHHEVLAEWCWDLGGKAKLRLRLLKPVSEAAKTPKIKAWEEARGEAREAREEAQEDLKVAHKQDCPDCPWDGNTIFPTEG